MEMEFFVMEMGSYSDGNKIYFDGNGNSCDGNGVKRSNFPV